MRAALPLILSTALTLGACSEEAGTEASPASPKAETSHASSSPTAVRSRGYEMTPEELSACDRTGGKVEARGLGGREHCVIPYPDADKPCASSDECIGACLSGPPPDDGPPGRCQKDNATYGCHSELLAGQAPQTACLD